MLFNSIFIFLSAVTLFACRYPEIDQDTVVTFLDSAPKSHDPLYSTDAISQHLNSLEHSALTQVDDDLQPHPEIASRMTVKDHTHFHFWLKEGLRFSDGSKLDAYDVRESFNRFISETNSPHHEIFSTITGFKIISPQEFTFETKKVEPFLLWDLSLLKIYKKTSDGKFIGAGRFVTAHESLSEFVLLKNTQNEIQKDLKLPSKIIFKMVREDTTRFQMIKRGDVNSAMNALALTTVEHLDDTRWKVINTKGINVSYLAFNFRNPILADKRVRQAIAQAIDYESILRNRIREYGYRSYGLLSELHSEFEPKVRHYDMDIRQSEKLLDEAGYKRGADGIRFTLEFKTTADKTVLDLVRIIADQLNMVGIKIKIRTVEFGTFFSDLKNGNFDLYTSRWVGISNPSIYYRVFHSSQAGKLNRGHYVNKVLDSLLEKAMIEKNDSRRHGYFSEVQKIVAEELPYVSLWHWNNTLILRKELEPTKVYPNGSYLVFAGLTRNLK